MSCHQRSALLLLLLFLVAVSFGCVAGDETIKWHVEVMGLEYLRKEGMMSKLSHLQLSHIILLWLLSFHFPPLSPETLMVGGGRRAATFDLQTVTCVDIVAMEDSVHRFDWEKVSNFIPLIFRFAFFFFPTQQQSNVS